MKNESSKENQHTLFVEGMHCPACENIIEKNLLEQKNIKKALVSIENSTVVVETSDGKSPDMDQLNEIFSESGYKFNITKPASRHENLIKAALVAGITTAVFILNERVEFIKSINIDASSNYLSFFIFGLIAGASSCAAMTGSILLALSKTWSNVYTDRKKYLPFIMFNLGRLSAFALFGGILGAIGNIFILNTQVSAYFLILISLFMSLTGLQMLDIKVFQKIRVKPSKYLVDFSTNQKNFYGKYMPFLIGAVTFFIPCSFSLIAQTNALASASYYKSSLMLLSFALGTLPSLAIISFTTVKLYSHKNLSHLFSYITGILIFIFSVYTINNQLNVLGLPSVDSLSHKDEISTVESNEGIQTLTLYVQGFEYSPNYAVLRVSVPTVVKIYNEGSLGCASSVIGTGLFEGNINIQQGYNEFNFVPRNKGTFKLTCSMGMVPPVTVKVE